MNIILRTSPLRRALVFASLLMSGTLLDAQPCLTIEWDVTIGGSGHDAVWGGVVNADGRYILVGSTNSPVSGEVSEPGYGLGDAWAVCLEPDGTILWEKRYGGIGPDEFRDVVITNDGGLLFVGFTGSPMSGVVSQPAFDTWLRDYWIVRTDALGNILWDRRYGGSGTDEAYGVAARTDGVFLLGGYSDSPVSGNKAAAPRGGFDYWVVAVDEAGTKLWDVGLGGSDQDVFGGIALAGANGAVITGDSYSDPSGDITGARRGIQDIWTVAIDATGTIGWQKRLGSNNQETPTAGVANVGGEFFIAGTSNSAPTLDLTLPRIGTVDVIGLWVSGTNGDLAFETRAGGADFNFAHSMAAINPASAASNIAIAGTTNSPPGGTITGIARGNYDYWLTIQSLNNTVVGQFRCGTDQWDELRKVLLTPDGGYLLAGHTVAGAGWDKTHDSRGSFDLWVVKVHPSGGMIWYKDSDGDGFGSASIVYFGCEPPIDYVRNDRDCDDTDPIKYTGAPCTGPGGAPDVLGPDCLCGGGVVGGVSVPVVMGLQGPMDGFSGLMDDGLRVNGLLPTWEPYSQLGFTVTENAGAQLDPAVFQIGGSAAIVDHVLVELRDPQSPGTVLASRVGLLRRDGLVVQFDGTTPFGMDAPPGWYHVAVRHRNHLGIMSAFPVQLSSQTPMSDLLFASPQTPVHGNDPQVMVGNTMCLWGGDSEGDGELKYIGGGNDRDPILVEIGGSVPTATSAGYLTTDVNMDGTVKYIGAGNDRDPILQNIGGSVPTATRTAQLP